MRNNKGFTLIEIMIALVIFAILAAITVQGLQGTATSEAKTKFYAGRINELNLSLALLNSDLSQVIDRPPAGQTAFVGTSSSITFTRGGVHENPLRPQASNLERVSYNFSNGQCHRLVWPVLDPAGADQPIDQVIIRDLQSIQFIYYDRNDQGQLTRTDSWPDLNNPTKVFPHVVQMILTLKNGGSITQTYPILAADLHHA